MSREIATGYTFIFESWVKIVDMCGDFFHFTPNRKRAAGAPREIARILQNNSPLGRRREKNKEGMTEGT